MRTDLLREFIPGTLVDWQFDYLNDRLVHPFDKALVNQATINMRIGDHLVIEADDLYEMAATSAFMGRLPCEFLDDGLVRLDISQASAEDPILVSPRQWLLTHTLEKVTIPDNCEAQVYLRSSAARAGWNHATACYVDGGFAGSITLELINYRRHQALKIFPGQELVQLKVTKHPHEPITSYRDTGRYFGDQSVSTSKDDSI